jgi:hypothetical protein
MRRFEQEWDELVAARTWLDDRGLRLTESRGPEGMDQGFDVYAGDRLGLKILADRSQWFVEVRPGTEGIDAGASDEWFTLEAWSVCLGAPVLFHDPRPGRMEDWAAVLANSWWLEPQLDYLREHFDQIEGACSAEHVEATIACLSTAQRGLSAFPPDA